MTCYWCEKGPVVDHAARPDGICPACNEPYSYGCKQVHHHDVYCIDICDIRDLPCGCYAHKECQKSGGLERDAHIARCMGEENPGIVTAEAGGEVPGDGELSIPSIRWKAGACR